MSSECQRELALELPLRRSYRATLEQGGFEQNGDRHRAGLREAALDKFRHSVTYLFQGEAQGGDGRVLSSSFVCSSVGDHAHVVGDS